MEVIDLDEPITTISLEPTTKEIRLNKDLDHDILLMNDYSKEKFIQKNDVDDSNPIQLITNSKLTHNTGVKLEDDDDSIYQITQIKERYDHDDKPITIYGGRKVIKGHSNNLLSNNVKTFKSSEISKIAYASSDNLEKEPEYISKNSQYIDRMVNAKYDNIPKITKKSNYNEIELLDQDNLLNSEQSAGGNTTSPKTQVSGESGESGETSESSSQGTDVNPESSNLNPESGQSPSQSPIQKIDEAELLSDEDKDIINSDRRNQSQNKKEDNSEESSNANPEEESSEEEAEKESSSESSDVNPEEESSEEEAEEASSEESSNVNPEEEGEEGEEEEEKSNNSRNNRRNNSRNNSRNSSRNSSQSQGLLSEEEIILEDFEEEDIDVVITEEELIPEEKIIANERDQANDLLNELMKMEPEIYRTKTDVINKNNKVLNRFNELKLLYSVKNEEGEIIDYRLNGNNYKKTLEDFLNSNFSNPQYIPLVNEQKKVFTSPEQDEAFEKMATVLEYPEDSFINKDSEELANFINIRNKYRKGNLKDDYIYSNEMEEMYGAMDAYTISKSEKGYETVLKHDTKVIRNCFSEANCMVNGFDMHILNGPFKTMEKDEYNIVDGTRVNINGIVKLPEKFTNYDLLNKATLVECINTPYRIHNPKEIVKELNVEFVDMNIEKGNNVKVCFNDKGKTFELSGTIIDIEDNGNSYIVKPLEDLPEAKYNVLKINRKDKDVVFTKESEIFKLDDGERLCFESNRDRYNVYLLPEVNNLQHTLDNIFPNIDVIINANYKELKKSNNFEELEKILHKYDISIDNLSYDNFKVLSEILDENLQKIHNKFKKLKQSYSTFLKRKPTYIKKQNFTINNSSLENVAKYYGNYPFFNTAIDSNEQRYKWVDETYDKGYLYYKYIIKGKQEFLKKYKDRTLEVLIKKKEDALLAFNSYTSQRQGFLSRGLEGCPEFRLVKIYKSKDDLDTDNLKEFVEIDSDKIVKAEKTNIVQVGQYAILEKSPTEKTLYKRIELASKKHLWVLETGKNIDAIIKTNLDFCNMQSKNLDEMTHEFFTNNACSFSSENGCVPKEVIELEKKIKEIEPEIEEYDRQIQELKESDRKTAILDSNIKKQELRLSLHQGSIQRKFAYEQKQYEEVKDEEEDEEFKSLYYKIDKYMEQITSLNTVKYYEALNILHKKYGRDAYEDDENSKNVYCVKGKKVLFCKHHLKLIELYRNSDLRSKENEEIYNDLIETYGIEDEGRYWCNNCGQEIALGEYETVEGFTKTGAHNVTHEELKDDDDETNPEDTMFKTLQMYINESDSKINQEGVLNILKVINVFLSLMGIKLQGKDELELLKQCEILEKSITSKKNKTAIVIFNVAAALFIKLQVAIPEYKVKKPHANCNVSLQGYPLDEVEENQSGIEYFSCMINNLKNSGEEWNELKKVKNSKKIFLKTLNVLLKEEYIQYMYKLKRTYLINKKEETNKVVNDWNRFKPPLKQIQINIEDYTPVSTENIKTLDDSKLKVLRDNYNERLQQLSLKMIEIIDTEVNSNTVENSLYQPTPLGNSCCMSLIDNDYKYNNYFPEEIKKNLSTINESLETMENSRSILLDNPVKISQNVYPEIPKSLFPTFRKEIFPKRENINNNTIMKLHLKFISEGNMIGEEHLFDFNNICNLTGENKNDIIKKDYVVDDYDRLINKVHTKTSLEVSFDKKIDSNKLKILEKILNENEKLKTITYINNIYNALNSTNTIKGINELYDDLETQINVEIDELVSKITSNLYLKKKEDLRELTNILVLLGTHKNIHIENQEEYGDEKSEMIMYSEKTKNIKKYIKNLKVILSKIINSKNKIGDDTKEFIKQNMNLKEVHLNKLNDLFDKEHEFIDYFIESSRENDNMDAFKTINELLKKNINHIDLLNGKNHIKDCKNQIKTIQKLTHKGASLLIHYIFVHLLDIIITLYSDDSVVGIDERSFNDEEDDESSRGGNRNISDLVKGIKKQNKSKNKFKKIKKRKHVKLEMRGGASQSNPKSLEELEGQTLEQLEPEYETEPESGETKEPKEPEEQGDPKRNVDEEEEPMDLTVNTKLMQNKNLVINEFIHKFLIKLGNDNKFIDKHTTKHNNEIINTQYENEKEDNLSFMAELDKESRRSFKALVAIGIDTYKNLSLKRKELYLSNHLSLAENQEKLGEPEMTQEEKNELNMQSAQAELGNNYTEDQYNEWLADKEHNEAEDNLAYEDRDILSDDDE